MRFDLYNGCSSIFLEGYRLMEREGRPDISPRACTTGFGQGDARRILVDVFGPARDALRIHELPIHHTVRPAVGVAGVDVVLEAELTGFLIVGIDRTARVEDHRIGSVVRTEVAIRPAIGEVDDEA